MRSVVCALCLILQRLFTHAFQSKIADDTGITTKSIVLEGDYNETVGPSTQKFLRECTTSLSSNGTRAVECVDVRPGSIIVDVRGKQDVVARVAHQINTLGLALPSFPRLFVAGETVNVLSVW